MAADGGGGGDGSGGVGSDLAERARLWEKSMTKDQYTRFVKWRASHLDKGAVRSHVAELIPESMLSGSRKAENKLVRAVQVTAKLFVCDLVERARTLMEKDGLTGAIDAPHYREAYQQLVAEGKVLHRAGASRPL